MAFGRWISRCRGGLAGKLFARPLPSRPRLPFITAETRGSPPPPPPPTPQDPRLAHAVGTSVPGPVRQAGGSKAPYIESVDQAARRLGAAACGGGVFFDTEVACGSRAPRLERDKEGDGEGARGRATAKRNLFDLLRHAAAGIDVSWRGPGQGGGRSSAILLRYRGGMIGTAAGIDAWDFAHLCCGNFSAASPLRRVGASGAGFTRGASSGPPLPEHDFSIGGSRCVLTGGLAARASCHQSDPMRREMRMAPAPHQYQQRRLMTSGQGGFPLRYGPFCRNGRTILNRPAFLPTQAPDSKAAIKYWKAELNVDGVVYDPCLDATSLLVKFQPDVYLKTHSLLESVPILGDTNGEVSWKITEHGKYTIKSLINLIGAFHDMGSCIEGLALDSVVISSAGKFELIQSKIEFTDLTEDGVRDNYRSAV